MIVGCENVPGFEAVANGDKVFPEIVEPGVVELAKEKIKQDPKVSVSVSWFTQSRRFFKTCAGTEEWKKNSEDEPIGSV